MVAARSDPPPSPGPGGTPQRRRPRPVAILIGAAIVGAVAGLAAVYGMVVWRGNAHVAAACRPALATAQRLSPLVRGEVAAVAVATAPSPVPDLGFRDRDGRTRTLGEWRGRLVLLNLWATWCVPCRKEMPALDALAAQRGGNDFAVVAVNIDTRDPAKPLAFLHDIGATHLDYYADPTAKVFQDLKAAGWAFGMPTTLLVDAAGCEVASLAGPADWASADAARLIAAARGS
jgi:thiol-disulfide isomerase/thioredoxin